MTTEVLHDLPGRDASKAGELAAVAGRIDADPEQTGGGVRATLTMANAGDTPVQMLNPYDLPQWQLLGDGGAPLQLPERRSNLRTRQPSDGEWKLDSAVRIVEVRRNGEPSDAAELDAATLALAAGDELGVTYELDRIVQGGELVALASGEYRIVCLVTLIDAHDRQRSRIVRCRPLGVRFERG